MNFFIKEAKTLLLGAVALCCCGCGINELEFEDISVPDYQPTLAVPLGVASYTMRDIVTDLQGDGLEMEEGDDYFLTIIFNDTSFNDQREAFLYFPPIAKNTIVFPFVSASPRNEVEVIEFEETVTFSFDPFFNEKVDSIFFDSGQLTLEINSRFRSDLAVDFEFPSLTTASDGEAVRFVDTLNFGSTVPVTAVQRTSLEGKKFVFRRVGDANDFDIVIRGKVIVQPGQSVGFADFLRFTLVFSDPTYSHVHAFVGRKQGLLQDRAIDLDFFETFGDYGLEFSDPKIKIAVSNSFGFPSGLLIDSLSASNSDSSSLTLTGPVTETLHFIDYPGTDSIGITKTTEVVINTQNSNIRELFGITPVRFNTPLTVITNPAEFTPNENNFITDSSSYTTITTVELPFEVRMRELISNRKFRLSGLGLEDLHDGLLRVYTVNEMPFEGKLAISFLDNKDSLLYQLPETMVLAAPVLDSAGRTVEAKTLLSEVELGPEGSAMLKRAHRINAAIIISTFEASNEGYVKLFADYKLNISISVEGQLKIELQ